MGVCGSKEGEAPPPNAPVSNGAVTTVEKQQATQSKNKPKQEVKMLLLGSGESGKSTVLKQIKILHQDGFSKRELYDFKPFVFKNIIECAQSLVRAIKQFNAESELKLLTPQQLEAIDSYETAMDDTTEQFNVEVANLIKKLIKEPVVHKLMEEKRNEFYILDSAQYFFDNIDRIFAENYLPSVEDVLRTRKQTSGIYDTKFQLEDIDIHLYDVGGQRSERKKWIHCFDNVTVIMFCVALSEYDQVLLESSSQNRLEESLNLFDSVVNSMWFRRTSIVLCLNKIDVFIEKLPRSPLENYFPDYVGGNDVNKAVKYILWRFRQLNRSNVNIMPYVTQATDTNNMKLAFAVVKETIIHNALMDSGILQA
ncbi:hypothetical protein KL905_002469 [Ogataea polymorpha]|uniref:Guanine nucleotide-binding protein alpha-2 subunit n=2 Tax=Ogataea polymorpha TaxID=460523 RepID=A0A9P8NUR4_9ASCO|nr:hypothetical protein KL937_002057 [Ogataea polymorpha]KAG7889292.1 hypothetical protein KL936_002866 [Ogataea polymorpha]KAG7906573.1 hypothetical protein KL907_002213 [Ogataea polymorpha]KAG7909820.1 hypothetical protein KL906_001725 [Ogataea polymorpha]KAG7921704.1 hypothetical protein KL905_002469 [Ogataea polymorpha]